jgi:hypothetical protein
MLLQSCALGTIKTEKLQSLTTEGRYGARDLRKISSTKHQLQVSPGSIELMIGCSFT